LTVDTASPRTSNIERPTSNIEVKKFKAPASRRLGGSILFSFAPTVIDRRYKPFKIQHSTFKIAAQRPLFLSKSKIKNRQSSIVNQIFLN
jgi:hypothetical protein